MNPGPPGYDNYGVQGQVRCFYGKMKNLNSVLKDVLECVLHHLNVVFTCLTKSGTVTRLLLLGSLSLILGLDLADGSFLREKGFMDI